MSESQQSYIHSQACWWIFSGFSVGCCINEERLSVTNLSSVNNLPMFRLNAPVVIRAKVKEVRNNVVIYSHALLRICIIGGQRLVRIAPPSLPPHHSGPATRDKLFSELKLVTDNLPSIYFGGCFTRSYTSVKLPGHYKFL